MKRDLKTKTQLFYNISIFGIDFHFKLTLNKHLVAPNFHVVTKHGNGTTTKSFPGYAHAHFYHGHSISHPGSKVALSDNGRLVSNFISSSIDFIVCFVFTSASIRKGLYLLNFYL